MPIERLLYPHNAGEPNPLGIVYEENGQEEKLKTRYGIRETIKNCDNYFKENLIIPCSGGVDESFRMGWSSAVFFTKCGSRLQVARVYNINSGTEISMVREFVPGNNRDLSIEEVRNRVFHQVTTQAVDTCTLICIETEDDFMLAHFNVSELGKFMDLLKRRAFPFSGAYQMVFFSGVLNEFNEKTLAAYNELKNWNKWAQFICFDRSAYGGEKKDHYFSHVEFGVGWDGSAATYFGDIVYRSANKPGEVSCACRTFKYPAFRLLSQMSSLASNLKNEADLNESLASDPKDEADPNGNCCAGDGCFIIS